MFSRSVPFRWILSISLVALTVATVCGCSGGGAAVDARTKTTVSGTLTVDGKPISAAGIAVVLQPIDGSTPVTLPVSSDGTFQGDAVAGTNYVIVSAGMTADAGHSEGPAVGFGPIFLSPDSPLTAEVTAGGAPLTLEVGKAAGAKLKPRKA